LSESRACREYCQPDAQDSSKQFNLRSFAKTTGWRLSAILFHVRRSDERKSRIVDRPLQLGSISLQLVLHRVLEPLAIPNARIPRPPPLSGAIPKEAHLSLVSRSQ
jgi:hypothetical protein